MVTQNPDTINIRVAVRGARRAATEMRGVAQSVGRVGSSARGLALPLVGAGLLTGAFGGQLGVMATRGGSASNAMLGLGANLRALFSPLGLVSDLFGRWFDGLPGNVQTLVNQFGTIGG